MRLGKEATYLNLAKHLFAGGLMDLLHQLCTIISKATSSTGKLLTVLAKTYSMHTVKVQPTSPSTKLNV
jgi:hypothetical protein